MLNDVGWCLLRWDELQCFVLSSFLTNINYVDLTPLGGCQSGPLSLVGIVEIVLSLVESFIELKYFHNVATPALRIQSPLLGAWGVFFLPLAGPLWHKRAGVATS